MVASLTRSTSERAFAVLRVVAFLQAVETKILDTDNMATFINAEIEKLLALVQLVITTTLEAVNFACVIGGCSARLR